MHVIDSWRKAGESLLEDTGADEYANISLGRGLLEGESDQLMSDSSRPAPLDDDPLGGFLESSGEVDAAADHSSAAGIEGKGPCP